MQKIPMIIFLHVLMIALSGYQVGDVNGPAYEKLRNREMEGKTIKGQISI